MEVQYKQKMQSKYIKLPNRESVNGELFDTSRLLEKVLARDNMLEAMYKVIRNKGSHGVDNMKADELREHVINTWNTVKSKLLEGKYNPSPVRRVEIPKPDGGIRLLGIPTVQDRMIQQAIAQILNEIYEPIFSKSSYGFRPGRGAKDAIKKSEEYINQGNKWVVDMDLEKFFDKVNHNILVRKLERRIKDQRLIKLIRKYLESGVLINGIKVSSEKGTPQGGPLSPLLANIIENELKLKVNINKSNVDLVSRRKFLGFSFYFAEGGAKIRIHEKSIRRFKDKIREITNKNKGISMDYRLIKLNDMIIGWVNYFKIANAS